MLLRYLPLIHKGRTMKKLLIALSLVSVALFPLSASPSWIGVQGFSSQSNRTTTYTLGSATYEEDSTATLGGMNIAGTIYPGDSPFGLGLQIGSAKMLKATNGNSDEDVSEYPLTYNTGVSGVYRLGTADSVALEFGLGLLFERMTKAANSDSSEVIFTLDSLSLLTSANLLVSLSDKLSLMGGLTALSNLNTNGKVTSGSFTYESDFDVKGYTLQGQVGVALGF